MSNAAARVAVYGGVSAVCAYYRDMKTVCLLGSPRRDGNSDRLAQRFLTKAEALGSEVRTFALSEIEFSGCRSLYRCKTDLDHCGQYDGLTPVLAAVAQADVVVLVSPIFFTNVTSQLKAAIDRFFSFLVPDYSTNPVKSRLPAGRTIVLVQTQGEAEEQYGDILERFSFGFRYLGFDHQYLVRAWGVRAPDDLEHHPDFLEECDRVAETVYANPD